MEDWKVDGIVLAPIGLEHSHLLESWNNGMPMVLVDRYFDQAEIPYVSTNDYQGTCSANEYLIENGHKNIACIQGLVGTSTNSHRVEGYKKALSDNGIAVSEGFIFGYDFPLVLVHLKITSQLKSTLSFHSRNVILKMFACQS